MFNGKGADMPPSMVMPKKTKDLGQFFRKGADSRQQKKQPIHSEKTKKTPVKSMGFLVAQLEISFRCAGSQLLVRQGKCPQTQI